MHPRMIIASIEPDKRGSQSNTNKNRMTGCDIILCTKRELISLSFDFQCSLLANNARKFSLKFELIKLIYDDR